MFRLRPSSSDDDEAVLRVLDTRERIEPAGAAFIRGLLLGQWRVGGNDRQTNAVVADDDGSVVAYGAVFPPGALAFVGAEHEGQGIGSALLAWVETRARELGRIVHRQPLPEGNRAGHALLARAGYRQVRSVIKLGRAIEAPPPVPAPPDGIVLRELDVARDARALHAADAAAFAGERGYEPETFEAFCDEHLAQPELDPALSLVARRGETIAGFALCTRREAVSGYVDLLAVDPKERRRGLGTMLLLSAFTAFANAGLRDVQLETASDNPRALRLYERAGMTARDRVDVFEKPEPDSAEVGSSA